MGVSCFFLVVRRGVSKWTRAEFHELVKIHEIHKAVLKHAISSLFSLLGWDYDPEHRRGLWVPLEMEYKIQPTREGGRERGEG